MSIRMSMNGMAVRSSHTMSATHKATATARAIQCGLGNESRNTSPALMVPANSTTPLTSMRLAIACSGRRCSGASLGTHILVSSSAMTVTGMLTRNVERQPRKFTSTPPMGGPTAIVTVPAIDRPPSTPPGGSLKPATVARRRMIIIAVGYPAEVPIPIRTRATATVGMSCPTPPMIPPRSTSEMPPTSTRRGPNGSASLPAVGWAIELAR